MGDYTTYVNDSPFTGDEPTVDFVIAAITAAGATFDDETHSFVAAENLSADSALVPLVTAVDPDLVGNAPAYQWSRTDAEKFYSAKVREYKTGVRCYLLGLGYTGDATGKVYRVRVADGYATYMVAAKGDDILALVDLRLADGYTVEGIENTPVWVIKRHMEPF